MAANTFGCVSLGTVSTLFFRNNYPMGVSAFLISCGKSRAYYRKNLFSTRSACALQLKKRYPLKCDMAKMMAPRLLIPPARANSSGDGRSCLIVAGFHCVGLEGVISIIICSGVEVVLIAAIVSLPRPHPRRPSPATPSVSAPRFLRAPARCYPRA
jgi:hypothetical protein